MYKYSKLFIVCSVISSIVAPSLAMAIDPQGTSQTYFYASEEGAHFRSLLENKISGWGEERTERFLNSLEKLGARAEHKLARMSPAAFARKKAKGLETLQGKLQADTEMMSEDDVSMNQEMVELFSDGSQVRSTEAQNNEAVSTVQNVSQESATRLAQTVQSQASELKSEMKKGYNIIQHLVVILFFGIVLGLIIAPWILFGLVVGIIALVLVSFGFIVLLGKVMED